MSVSRRQLISGFGGLALSTASPLVAVKASATPAARSRKKKYFPPSEPSIPPIYQRADRPNIVLILADDLGFSDAGCYGGDIDTPHIDSLTERGMQFTNARNEARCAPTRASFLTGLYPTQAGIGNMPGTVSVMKQYQQYLRKNVLTVAEIASIQGYGTGHFGKWHVGHKHGSGPADRGFDHTAESPSSRSYWSTDWEVDGVTAQIEGYSTDVITRYAVEYVAAQASTAEPFLLSVAYTAPHFPLHHPDDEVVAKYRERYRDGWKAAQDRRLRKQNRIDLFKEKVPLSKGRDLDRWRDTNHRTWEVERMAVYAAQVETMDTGIGAILAELRRQGVYDNTVVIFASDNGGSSEDIKVRKTPDGVQYGNIEGLMPGGDDTVQSYGDNWATVSNTPFAEHKRRTGEGGVATPLIISWPERFKRPRTYHGHVNLIDVTPTVVSLIGADLAKRRFRYRDGVKVQYPSGLSLVSVFDREPSRKLRNRTVCWEHVGNRAVRMDHWKLVRSRDDDRWRLYDLRNDRSESHDVAARHPKVRRELHRAWKQWANWVNVGKYSWRNGEHHYAPHKW